MAFAAGDTLRDALVRPSPVRGSGISCDTRSRILEPLAEAEGELAGLLHGPIAGGGPR
jgi:hypothetical protein